jgi:hypothetical protein
MSMVISIGRAQHPSKLNIILVCTKEKRNSAQEYLRRADRGADRSAGGSQRLGL